MTRGRTLLLAGGMTTMVRKSESLQRTLGRFQTTVSVSALLNKVSNCEWRELATVASGRCHSRLDPEKGRFVRANDLFEAACSAKVASTSVRLNIGIVLKPSSDPDLLAKTRTSPVSPKVTWRRPSPCTSIILPRPYTGCRREAPAGSIAWSGVVLLALMRASRRACDRSGGEPWFSSSSSSNKVISLQRYASWSSWMFASTLSWPEKGLRGERC